MICLRQSILPQPSELARGLTTRSSGAFVFSWEEWLIMWLIVNIETLLRAQAVLSCDLPFIPIGCEQLCKFVWSGGGFRLWWLGPLIYLQLLLVCLSKYSPCGSFLLVWGSDCGRSGLLCLWFHLALVTPPPPRPNIFVFDAGQRMGGALPAS